MTLLHKKKNHYQPRWISMTFIWSPTLLPRGIIILKGVLTKFHFQQISTSGKNCQFNKGLKI